jgi:hypothetical protein
LKMQSTTSTRHEMWRSFAAPSTNKLYDATTSAMCALVSSTSETWSSDEFKVARMDPNSHPLGRGHSSSTRCSNP